jgi:UDP-N-acetylglucosamine 2-epimerase
MRVLFVFGTRPEAKLAPVVQELSARPGFACKICVTGQHREMLAQVLDLFALQPDWDLGLMRPNQDLAYLTGAAFVGGGRGSNRVSARSGHRARRYHNDLRRGARCLLPSRSGGACRSRLAHRQHLFALAGRGQPPVGHPHRRSALCPDRAGPRQPAAGRDQRGADCGHRQHRDRWPVIKITRLSAKCSGRTASKCDRRVLFVFGTRPEVIKLAPVVKELSAKSDFVCKICVTGQHREMLAQALELFALQPDWDLGLMRPNHDLAYLTGAALSGVSEVLNAFRPDRVVVQGDTTTTTPRPTSAMPAG